MRKNVLSLVLVSLALVQIVLLIGFIFPQSYFMHIVFGDNLVSASENIQCCTETNEGAICEDVPVGLSSDAPNSCSNPIATSCEEVAECEVGCCFDPDEGLCTPGSSKGKCEADGGEWSSSDECSNYDCQKGCCVVGNDVKFVTETRCEVLADAFGFSTDFRDYETELECLALAASQFEGACMFDDNVCIFETESECVNDGGRFYQDYLCSNPNLETDCQKQDSVGCVEGEDEIYWFDSCGNKENIYSSNLDSSWNDGMVLSKEDSCNSASGNINSTTCGNCARALGSACTSTIDKPQIVEGDYVCEDLTCVDEWGNKRMNGESWCSYDGYIGNGKDTAGSRHWKVSCYNGEIITEGCGDYRTEICVQSEIESGSKTFSQASCVANDAMSCVSYNSNDNMESLCQANKDCMVESVWIDSDFHFDVCVPRYPIGFSSSESASAVCSLASQSCTIVEQKDFWGNWDIVSGAGCASAAFGEKMNDFCTSLGDCGSYVNYIGEGSSSGGKTKRVSGATGTPKAPSWDEYTSYANPVEGQYAEPDDLRTILATTGGSSTPYEGIENDTKDAVKMIGTVAGGVGTLITGLGWAFGETVITTATTTLSYAGGTITSTATMTAATEGAIASSGFVGPTLASIGTLAAALGIGMAVGGLLAWVFGVQGNGATALMIAGGIGGLAAGAIWAAGTEGSAFASGGSLAMFEGGGAFTTLGFAMVAVIAVAVVFMAYVIFSGWGDTRESVVKFTCAEWQAPTASTSCEKCNEDEEKVCTEYRCNSLGKTCRMLNENTDNPTCETIPREVVAPVITLTNVSNGYEFGLDGDSRSSISLEGGGCIPEWTLVNFTLTANENAQCKYSFTMPGTISYDDMEGSYTEGDSSFREEHNFYLNMPHIGGLEVYNVTGDIREMFGNANLYVRCQDYWGNYNIDEYVVNFCVNTGDDLTAVYQNQNYAIPANGAYLKEGTEEVNVTIWTNEPAECKYDYVEGIEFDLMKYNMTCENEVLDQEIYGWPCNTTLNVSAGTNSIYVKCKDQPWYKDTVNESKRNINEEDWEYALHVSESELAIDSIFFEFKGADYFDSDIIESGYEPVSINMVVETSGGADDGVSECSWGVIEDGSRTDMRYTFSNEHEQVLSPRMAGVHTNYIECVDEAGNVAKGQATFDLEVDAEGPRVTRTYENNGNLKVVTDENAECYYDLNRCNFDFDEAIAMTDSGVDHTTEWIVGQTYYIKCKDEWGNANTDCAIIVRAEA